MVIGVEGANPWMLNTSSNYFLKLLTFLVQKCSLPEHSAEVSNCHLLSFWNDEEKKIIVDKP